MFNLIERLEARSLLSGDPCSGDGPCARPPSTEEGQYQWEVGAYETINPVAAPTEPVLIDQHDEPYQVTGTRSTYWYYREVFIPIAGPQYSEFCTDAEISGTIQLSQTREMTGGVNFDVGGGLPVGVSLSVQDSVGTGVGHGSNYSETAGPEHNAQFKLDAYMKQRQILKKVWTVPPVGGGPTGWGEGGEAGTMVDSGLVMGSFDYHIQKRTRVAVFVPWPPGGGGGGGGPEGRPGGGDACRYFFDTPDEPVS